MAGESSYRPRALRRRCRLVLTWLCSKSLTANDTVALQTAKQKFVVYIPDNLLALALTIYVPERGDERIARTCERSLSPMTILGSF